MMVVPYPLPWHTAWPLRVSQGQAATFGEGYVKVNLASGLVEVYLRQPWHDWLESADNQP